MVLPTISTLEPATLPCKRRQKRQETMDLVLLSICVKPEINWDYLRSIDTYWYSNKITCGQFRIILQAKMQPIITWSFPKKIVIFSNPYRAFCVPRGLPSRPACQVAQWQWQGAVKGDQKLSKNLHKSAGIYPTRQHFIWKIEMRFWRNSLFGANWILRFVSSFLEQSYHSVLFKSNAWSHDGNLVFKTHWELNEYSLDKIILDGDIHITLHIQTVTTQCKVTLKVVLYKKFFSFFILDVCGHN